MRILYCSILLLIGTCGLAQTIPSARTVDWSLAGHKGGLPEPTNQVNFLSSGGVPNGTTANDLAFSIILSAHSGDSLIIYFPNGIYYFTQTLNLPGNIILRGESIDSTVLLFDLGGAGHLISASGSMTTDSAQLMANAAKGDTAIQVSSTAAFSVGDHIRTVDEDSANTFSWWARYSTGQYNTIDSIAGSTIYLSSPLRRSYAVARDAFIVRTEPVENVGIENLKIERLDATTAQTSNIRFNLAYNSWVKCVESEKCNFAHIEISNSSNIEVTGSYIHDAFSFGSGGKAYGVLLQFGSGECLIADNTFERLRHSMILQAGPNGNVLAYNYSTDPFWTGTFLPSNSAGDLVLHGNYPYANLFEGNTVQNIVIDDSHDKNGPFNTFFRNRAELYGIAMSSAQAGDSLNVVGNEITGSGFLLGNYILYGNGNFEHGNNKNGTIMPSGTANLPEQTLFLDSVPPYYQSNSSWPPLGVPNTIGTHKIEAEVLFDAGITSTCSSVPVTSLATYIMAKEDVKLVPNPTLSTFQVQHGSREVEQVRISSLAGKVVLTHRGISDIDVSGLSSGIYFVNVYFTDQSMMTGKLVKE